MSAVATRGFGVPAISRVGLRFPASLRSSSPWGVAWGITLLTCLWQGAPALAQNYTWTGAAGTGNWQTAANWISATTNAPPLGGANITLAGGTQLSGSTSSRTATGLTFASNAGPFVINPSISGQTLTVSGPVTNLSGTTQTIALGVTVTGTRTLDTGSSSSGAVVFGGQVAGAAQLDVVGSGRAVFNAANNNSVKVTVASGATVTGTGRIPSLTVQSGGVVTPGGASTTSYGTLTLGTGSTSSGGFVVTGGSSATVAMGISGTARGTAYDTFVINGTGNQYGGVLAISFDNATSYEQGTTFNLFQLNQATPAGNFTAVQVTGGEFNGLTFSGPVNGEWLSTANAAGRYLTFSQVTGNLIVVPEPATAMIAFTGVAFVGFHGWRRRSGRLSSRGRV